jgi:hypothetical protein
MCGMNTAEASKPRPSRKIAHLKNSHSEGNDLHIAKRPAPIHIDEHSASCRALQRSESSPGTAPTRTAAGREGAQVSLQPVYSEDDRLYSYNCNRAQPVNDLSEGITRGRGFAKTSVKPLGDVPEIEENVFEIPPRSHKRSRSPMRKIFGEGGWLSNPSPKDDSGTPKKPGLVEKFRSKMGEIVGVIDLNWPTY